MRFLWPSALIATLSILLGAHYTGHITVSIPSKSSETEKFSCRPFLPKLFLRYPPSQDHPEIAKGSKALHELLSQRFSVGDIDSLSVAVVGPGGSLFEENYGVRRGNESTNSLSTDSHSAYRIASVGKLFTVLEGHILAQKGVISWDDPVEKYLPEFKYRRDSISQGKHEDVTIALSHLAGHTSGLGRDWPPGNVANWPKDMMGAGPPPTNGLPFPSHEDLYKAVAENHLVTPPSTWPLYSNAGIGLLGMALVAANRQVNGKKEPETFAQLVHRDVFEKIGMNDSHFLASESNKHQVVVPSLAPMVADQDFLDAMNPCAGQFSSLHDSTVFLQNLLCSGEEDSLLTRHTFDSWIYSAHSFEEDDWTETGFVWEIIKAPDSNNRLRKIYWKLGAMAGYHAALAIHPGTMYGIAVLLAGNYPDAAKITYDAFEVFQPYIDNLLAQQSTSLYVGNWQSPDGESKLKVNIDKGTLYVDELFVNGMDLFTYYKPFPGRIALRPTGVHDEFRIDVGIPFYNGQRHMGCYPYWAGLDLWGQREGAPLNALYFSGEMSKERSLYIPSTGAVLKRV